MTGLDRDAALLNQIKPLFNEHPPENEFGQRFHVGVMDVHNVTGDFTTQFPGVCIGEIPVNPADNGITFFRFHKPPHRDEPKAEAIIFSALHKEIGLDAVILFDGSMYRSEKDSVLIAEAVKGKHADIKTILLGHSSKIFEAEGILIKQPPEQTINNIRDNRLGFVATKSGTISEQIDADRESSWHKNILKLELAESFDAVVGNMSFREADVVCALMGLPPLTDDKRGENSRRSFGLIDCYREAIPDILRAMDKTDWDQQQTLLMQLDR